MDLDKMNVGRMFILVGEARTIRSVLKIKGSPIKGVFDSLEFTEPEAGVIASLYVLVAFTDKVGNAIST